MSKIRLDSKLLLCAAAFGALSVAGCATEAGANEDAVETAALEASRTANFQTQTTPPPPPPGGVVVPNPEGSYFASVVPLGTGCPIGTTSTSISDDGQVFTVTFSEYEVNINDQTPDLTVTKDCQLAIKLWSPGGLSYAVTSFYYSGYAYLEPGVTASQWARYYFQGNPQPPASSNRTQMVGPYDADFVFKDDVKTADTVWSPCGTARDLNVLTRLQLRNASPKRSGYANLTAIDGSTKLELRIAWRSCNGAPIPPPLLPDAGITRGGN